MRLLRVLDGIFKFPRLKLGIEYVVNLRFLVIDILPTGIDKLVNLEINIKKVKDEELLKCSPRLRKLKCTYKQERMDMSAYPHFDLRFLTQLNSLSLFGVLKREDFGFPSNIRKLTLKGSSLPWEKMSIIGRLEFLEVLKLNDGSYVGERWDTRDDEFQKLRFLELKNIQLSEWNVPFNEHFPKLQQLILIGCENLREIPGEIGEITTLKLIEVNRKCQNSMVVSAERIKQEQWEMGNEELKIIINTATYEEFLHSPHAANVLTH